MIEYVGVVWLEEGLNVGFVDFDMIEGCMEDIGIYFDIVGF